MPGKTYRWVRVAEYINELSFSSGGLALAEAGGKSFCLACHYDKIFAVAPKCPHAGGPMSAGYVDALGNIVCPLHRYKFNLSTGRNTSGEGYFLKTWPVEVRDDGVWVGLDD